MTDQEIEDGINEWVKGLPMYGEFTIDGNDPTHENTEANTGIKPYPLYTYERTQHILQFMVFMGFAVYRHEIKIDDARWAELTDEGRTLKSLGTLAKYREKERIDRLDKEEEIKYKKSEQQRTKYMFWITMCIAFYTASQGIYNALETVKSYYSEYLPIAKNIIVPYCFWGFVLYILYIVLKELLQYLKRRG